VATVTSGLSLTSLRIKKIIETFMVIIIFYSHRTMADVITIIELLLNSKRYKLAFLDLFVSETAQGAPKSDMKDL
jgi:hypothetical protein